MNVVIQETVRKLRLKYTNMTDEAIVKEIIMGHHAGDALFYLLFGRYADMLKLLFSKQSQTLMDFDDFMLELDIRLFKEDCRAIKCFDSDKASFKTYLSTIARNLLYDLREKELPALDVQSIAMELQEHSDMEDVMWLIEEINHYPNKDSRYVLLKTIEGYRSKEIAVMLTSRKHEDGSLAATENLKPSYIDTLRSRALKAIRNRISSTAKQNAVEPCMPDMSVMQEKFMDYCEEADASMLYYRSSATPRFLIDNLFVSNILNLYHQMIEI